MHRFFVEAVAPRGEAVQLGGRVAHQIARVLRLRPGEWIVLLDGSGDERLVELTRVSPSSVLGLVRERRQNRAEPSLAITLYQGSLRREKMELVLQKGTEVGVAAFVPVRCERTIVGREPDQEGRRLERWRRIVTEAAEQSRRGRVPEVMAPAKLADALEESRRGGISVVAWEGERVRSVRSVLRELTREPLTSRRLNVFIGPEGGFTDREVELATGLGAKIVSLGPRILRAETAGPIVAALALYEAGDMEA